MFEILSHQRPDRITLKRFSSKEILGKNLRICEFRVNSSLYLCVPKVVMVAIETRVYDAA
jgi:hypothetical protein